jgi:cytidylate kinase
MPVITISRELGSDGTQIAEAVAAKLGAAAVDKEVLAEMARQAGVAVEVIAQAEERLLAKPVMVSDEMRALLSPRGSERTLTEARFVKQMAAAIQLLAQQGNVVFVGRGAQLVLKDAPQALHVHTYAAPAVRAARLQQRRGLPSVELALRAIHQADEQRQNWYRHFFSGTDWKHTKHYHLLIDTGRIPAAVATELILLAAQTTS